MSFDYWWIGCFIDEQTHTRLQPFFAAAAAGTALSPEARQAIAAWRVDPRGYEDVRFGGTPETTDQESYPTTDQINAFLNAFNLAAFAELARHLILQGGGLTDLLNERNLFRMTITARHPSVSIVWHALGPSRAEALPGQMGNMLLGAGEIAAALEATRRAYSGISPDDLFSAGQRFCGFSVDAETLREVLYFLPHGLERAKERGRGFFAVTSPQM